MTTRGNNVTALLENLLEAHAAEEVALDDLVRLEDAVG
jgi:hypothetical protein